MFKMALEIPIFDSLPFGLEYSIKADDSFIEELSIRLGAVVEDIAPALKWGARLATTQDEFLDIVWNTVKARTENRGILTKLQEQLTKLEGE